MAEDKNQSGGAPQGAAIICAPVKGTDDMAHINGSIKDRCADCGCEIWIAPTGVALRAQYDATPICAACGRLSLKNNPETTVMPPTPEQIREVMKAQREDEACM